MRISVFASSFVVATGVLALASTAQAVIVSANLPTVNGAGLATGFASDAYSSNGNYAYGQSVATPFTAAQSYNLSQLTWWGFSENFIQAGLANVAGFQMQILSSDKSTVVVNKTWTLAELAVQATGNLGVTGGIEYQFAGGLNNFLAAGSYWLNVGFVAVNGQDDAWIWSNGLNPAGALAGAFSNNDGGWMPWESDFQGGMSHILFGQVPGPGPIALLAVGGLISRRRRS